MCPVLSNANHICNPKWRGKLKKGESNKRKHWDTSRKECHNTPPFSLLARKIVMRRELSLIIEE
jgi:hypothetical protein